jgi:replicative DNA helicase
MSNLKFAKNITSRISTVNLERQLLHALLADRINLQRSLGKHRSDFFTNTSRLFIYDCIRSYFDDKHAVLSKNQFEFEIQKRYDSERDKAKIEDLISEFEIIKKTSQTEGVDGIISSLEEVQLANATDALIRETYAELEKGNYQAAANLLRQKSIDLKDSQKEGRIINLHEDSDDWFEEVQNRKTKPEQYAGIPTGFEKFDNLTGGLFPAELTIVFGLSGKGKSTFMKALTCNLRKQGRVILHCGNEENEFQIRSKYMSADSGEKYSPFKNGTYTEESFKRLKAFSDNARGVGAIYIYEFPQQTDATWIERAYRYLEMQGVKVDAIVVDYLDLMKPIGTAYSENDEQGKVTSDLKQLAINCHCPVITATQAGTSSEKQEKKEKPFLTAADVFGTKRKVHSANCLIGIVNKTATAMANEKDVKDRLKHHMVLCVPKNRDGAVFTFRQIMDVECGKFYEDTDENDPMMKALEKQAGEMISEDPNNFRAEIDIREIHQAQIDDYNERIKNLNMVMNSSNTEEDESGFYSDAPEEDVIEESTEFEINQIEEESDDFFNDAPDMTEVLQTSSEASKNENIDNINDIYDDEEEYNEMISKPEETKSEEKKLSDTISHKKSLAEILAEKKAKANIK